MECFTIFARTHTQTSTHSSQQSILHFLAEKLFACKSKMFVFELFTLCLCVCVFVRSYTRSKLSFFALLVFLSLPFNLPPSVYSTLAACTLLWALRFLYTHLSVSRVCVCVRARWMMLPKTNLHCFSVTQNVALIKITYKTTFVGDREVGASFLVFMSCTTFYPDELQPLIFLNIKHDKFCMRRYSIVALVCSRVREKDTSKTVGFIVFSLIMTNLLLFMSSCVFSFFLSFSPENKKLPLFWTPPYRYRIKANQRKKVNRRRWNFSNVPF